MNKFRTIMAMQLKEKLDLGFMKSKKQLLFKIVFSILGFVAVTGIAYLVFFLCHRLNIFSPLGTIPVSVMSVVLGVVLLINLFTTTTGISKSLFYAKDNQVLITYPVNPNTLFVSKIVVYFISEIRRAFNFIIPIFFAYGIVANLPIYFYLWVIVLLTILTAVVVLLSALLAIPMNYVLRFLQRFPILKITLLGVVLIAMVIGVYQIIMAIPADINLIRIWVKVSSSIRGFLSKFVALFPWLYNLTVCLCGSNTYLATVFWSKYSWIVPLCSIALGGILLGLNLLTSRPLYLKMMTKEFEFTKQSKTRVRKNHAHRAIWSACLNETRRDVRHTGILSVTLTTLIVAPMAILLLNRLYSAINTRLTGDFLTIMFNVMIIMLFVLAHNISASSIFSRDGEALYLNKTKPVPSYAVLLPRLFYYIVTSTMILAITSCIFFAYSKLAFGDRLLCFIAMWCIAVTHIVWSADFDFSRPQANIFKTEGAAGNNPNEIKSIILCFALAIITAALTMFWLNDAYGGVWIKLCLFSIILLGLRVWLLLKKTRVLFREM